MSICLSLELNRGGLNIYAKNSFRTESLINTAKHYGQPKIMNINTSHQADLKKNTWTYSDVIKSFVNNWEIEVVCFFCNARFLIKMTSTSQTAQFYFLRRIYCSKLCYVSSMHSVYYPKKIIYCYTFQKIKRHNFSFPFFI